jgi:ABC-type polysaccharide/polyol phosphate transport system ATPase subunit
MPVQNRSSGMKVRLVLLLRPKMKYVLIIDEVFQVGDLGFALKQFENH